MKTILLIIFIITGTAAMCCLIKFLQYFVSDWLFLKHCHKVNGHIVRWVSTSSNTTSYRSSWWSRTNDWSPVISYYDSSLGTSQEHEAILPKGCSLSQHFSPPSIEVQYYGRHVRICDDRFVNNNIYSGYQFFIAFGIFLFVCMVAFVLYTII